MRAAIIVFPGTNREGDMAKALTHISGKKPDLVWHKETSLKDYDLIVLPGGFSYGDYLRCGAMAAHSPIMKEVVAKAKSGTRLLAVCNGFQMLVETGLVPGALLRNHKMKFVCKQVYLRAENNNSDFTRKFTPGQIIRVPVAHGEGNYFVTDDMVKEMQDKDQVAFYYTDAKGNIDPSANPNGSVANIAVNATNSSITMMEQFVICTKYF